MMDLRSAADQIAQRYGLDPALFARVIQQESAWMPDAVSPAGAIGLGQLMPGTAKDLGVDPRDPMQNLDGAARYLKQQLDDFGEVPLALAAYNAGPGNVRKHGGIPPFRETRNYVERITGGDDMQDVNPMRIAPTGRLGNLPAPQAAREPAAQTQEQGFNWRERLPDILDSIAAASQGLTLNPNAQVIQGAQRRMGERRQMRAQQQQANKTADYIERLGGAQGKQLADAVRNGEVPAAQAMKMVQDAMAPPKQTSAQQNYEYLIQQGIPPDQALARAFSGGVTVNTGDSGPQVGSIPKGYQLVKDEAGALRMEPIPGGPAAREVEAEGNALQMANRAVETKFRTVDQSLTEAIGMIDQYGRMVAGAGSLLSALPESAARDFQAKLDTIKANLGFEELQRMRDASPTGGALGQVSEREINFLQAMQGNLDAAQSPEQLMKVLQEIQSTRREFARQRREILGGGVLDQESAPRVRTYNPETGRIE